MLAIQRGTRKTFSLELIVRRPSNESIILKFHSAANIFNKYVLGIVLNTGLEASKNNCPVELLFLWGKDKIKCIIRKKYSLLKSVKC